MRKLTQEQRDAVRTKLKMLSDRYRNPKHPWYANSPLLRYLVQWIIYFSIFCPYLQKKNKFKVGDRVKYNWKALIQIYSVGSKDMFRFRIVSEVMWYGNLKFSDGTGCDPFNIRRFIKQINCR